MIYGSVCSGIEAATVAWHPLGWKPAFFAEIEKFPSAVLAHHYPHVPNFGDFTRSSVFVRIALVGIRRQSLSMRRLQKARALPLVKFSSPSLGLF